MAPDLNPDGTAKETDKFIYPYGGYPSGKDLPIDHFDIVGVVESDLIKVLTQ